jgi:hypothetical protein
VDRRRLVLILASAALAANALPVAAAGSADAAIDCTFTTVDTTLRLDADCETDTTITIPDGFTIDGRHHWITAVDPYPDKFRGAVVQAIGGTANVKRLLIRVDVAEECEPSSSPDAISGILFDGARGLITDNAVVGVGRGPTCDEGHAIVVRNATHAIVTNNLITDFWRVGVFVSGGYVAIEHNEITTTVLGSITESGIIFNNGARGSAFDNTIQVASPGTGPVYGVLVRESDEISVFANTIGGGTWGIWLDAICQSTTTGGASANDNFIAENTVTALYEGIVVTAQTYPTLATCAPVVDGTQVTANRVFAPQTGIFVGAVANDGTFTPTVSNTDVRRNRVTATGSAQNGIAVMAFETCGCAPIPVTSGTNVVRNTLSHWTTPILQLNDVGTTVSHNTVVP